MRALETIFEAETKETAGTDAGVDLWSDSVEEAARQLGMLVTLAIVVHLAYGVLSGIASAFH
jgi:hypothetical protein